MIQYDELRPPHATLIGMTWHLELEAADGAQVMVLSDDDGASQGTLVILPQAFALARRS